MRRRDLMRTQLWCKDHRANIFEQASLGDDVAHVRNVVQRYFFGGQYGRCHARQRRILGAANRNPTLKRTSAGNAKLIHDWDRLNEKALG